MIRKFSIALLIAALGCALSCAGSTADVLRRENARLRQRIQEMELEQQESGGWAQCESVCRDYRDWICDE